MAAEARDIAGLIFSWKLHDILNHKLYKSQVKEIPRTFSSISQYLATFQTPLIEEIRSELRSNLDLLSHTPVWDILSVKRCQSSVHDKKLLVYTITVRQLNDSRRPHDPNNKPSSPKSGDVLALSTVRRPRSVGDLIRSNRPCTLALVTGSDEDEEGPVYTIEVRPSRSAAASWEMAGLKKKEPLYAIVLANLVTSNRIWVSLNLDQEKQIQCSLLKIALYNGPSEDNCGCWSSDGTEKSSKLGADLSHFELNDSQIGAVLSCLAGRKCNHRPAAKLIWGPPGTGKTKTVSTLLWCLLAEKCRTVTCAPTNVAVVQIAKRLMGLLEERVPSGCSNATGDVLLFGNEDKMKINENGNLKDIFLKHRVNELRKCFAPLTGWNHQVEELKALLEKCFTEYNSYVDDEKENGNLPITFKEYIRRRFATIAESLKVYMTIFRKHLPSHMMTPTVSRTYFGLNGYLDLIRDGLSDSSIIDFDLENVYTSCVKVKDNEACTGISATRFELLPSSGQKYAFDLDDGEIDDTSMTFEEICNVWRDRSTRSLWKNRINALRLVLALKSALKIPANATKQSIEEFCLANATLILCTASGSFRLRSIPDMPPIELLIVDEAAQLKECESLITMQIPGLRHAVLIGDECQLPAVVMSEICQKAYFGRSLFERLVSLGHDKHLLNIQYRMHPSISVFPNTKFYNGQITDGENVKSSRYEKQYLEGKIYGSYSFINVYSSDKEGSDAKHSKRNMAEVEIVSVIVENLFEAFKKSRQRISVGIISPYTAQVHAIAKKIGKRYEKLESGFTVDVKSVDGFQGAEEDVIIMSTVRSNMNGSIGFLSNLQRTNVALTRAKHCLWILGNGTTLLNSGSIWNDVVVDAKSRGCFFNSAMDRNLIEDVGNKIDLLNLNIEDYRSVDSSLFSKSKWKVFFTDDFKKSFVDIEEASIRCEIIEFVKMLSNGFSPQNTQLNEGSFCSHKLLNLLKYYDIQDQSLFWTVEIFKDPNSSNYTQVLKFWDTLPMKESAKLLKKLKNIVEKYSSDYASRCRFRCLDGFLEVPMFWAGGDQSVLHPTDTTSGLPDDLEAHFASLNLGGSSFCS